MYSSYPPPKSQAAPRRRRILLVDDDPTVIRSLYRALLQLRPDWELSFAESGLRALEQLREQSWDALVTDLHMPELSGLDLLRHALAFYPETLRVVHSSHAETTGIELVRLANAVFQKPTRPEQLAAALDELLSAPISSRDRVSGF